MQSPRYEASARHGAAAAYQGGATAAARSRAAGAEFRTLKRTGSRFSFSNAVHGVSE
jgi:hypothetical protein